jgi:hypothetical protein
MIVPTAISSTNADTRLSRLLGSGRITGKLGTESRLALTGVANASNKRAYHMQAGNWLREHRGIYRLALFAEPDHSDLILWWFWSGIRSDQPSGVYSHQTALSLHEL